MRQIIPLICLQLQLLIKCFSQLANTTHAYVIVIKALQKSFLLGQQTVNFAEVWVMQKVDCSLCNLQQTTVSANAPGLASVCSQSNTCKFLE